MPYSLANNAAKFVLGGFPTADDYFAFQKDGFDLVELSYLADRWSQLGRR